MLPKASARPWITSFTAWSGVSTISKIISFG